MKILLNIAFLNILVCGFLLGQVGVNIEFQNRSWDAGTNTWTFDLVASRTVDYPGNWSGMTIRTNIVVPSGVTIPGNGISGTPVHPSVTSATYQNTFTGGSVAGSVKFQVSLDRATAGMPDLPLPNGTQVVLATFDVVFSAPVPGGNLVTPRPFGGTAQSFYNTITDATARPFGLPAAFPLPIKLSSFSAVKDGDRSARLDWTSSSEVNSAYFGVERSSDGTSWETIGKVNAAGNSSAELAYQYYDRNLPISRSNDQVFYYRLQLVDIDGKYKYSDVRGVNFKGISSTDVISLYPNPTTSMVNIDLREMDINHGIIDLKVVDMAGRYVINKIINGNGIEAVDVSRFDAGTYQVMVTQGSKQHQKRFIKVN